MDEDEKKMLFNEINNLKDLDHPNILKMYEFFEDEKRYYIITDVCKGGELFDEIKKSAGSLDVKFTGWMVEPFNKLKDFDLLMMTSKNEGLPLVILEAARYSKATISTNVGGVSEFIEDNKTGYLVPRDSGLMATKILAIAKNKTKLYEIGVNARHLLESDFSVQHMAKLHFDLYSKLTKN